MTQPDPLLPSRADATVTVPPATPTPPAVTATSTASTATSTPPLVQSHASTDVAGIVVAAVLSGAFLAALTAAGINIWLARRKSREEERNRLRIAFAQAFAAYTAYKEFPYAIRRRRADVPDEERVRLSEALREIQSDLAYHIAWTAAESETVGRAYGNLVRQLRATAGDAMHQAWAADPISTDTAMNIPSALVDLSALTPYESAYMTAVRDHLRRLSPWWAP